MPEEWERREGETIKAYAAFCAYRELGPDRSIPKALAASGRLAGNIRYWEEWSRTCNWVERAKAYDDHVDEVIRKRLESKRVRSAERQVELAEAMIRKAKDRVEGVALSDLTPQDVARWVDVASKTERLALGEPTEIGKQQITMPNILEVTLTDELPADEDPEEAPSRTDKSVAN